MNAPRNAPNKRLPDVIYLRRRVAALVIILIVAVLFVVVVSKFAGGRNNTADNNPGSSPSAVASAASATSSSKSSEASESSEASDSSEGKPSSSLAAPSDAESAEPKPAVERGTKNTCELADLIISARSDQNSFAGGEQPRFYMTVDNPTNADCDIDLADNALRFEVYDLATNKRVWSDMDCAAHDEDSQIFPAGEQRYYEVIWSRTGSAPNSCTNREVVPDGGYYLYTLVGDNHSDPITFNLYGNE